MARNPLSYDISDYTPHGLNIKDQKDVRREYIRLRRVAEKRLRRLEEAGFSGMQIYKYNKNAFERSSELSDADLRFRLSQLADFIMSPESTVTGVRKSQRRMINTLHKHGYTGIDKSNIAEFGRFMDRYRASHLDKVYGSRRVAKISSESRSGKLTAANRILIKAFNAFIEDQRT